MRKAGFGLFLVLCVAVVVFLVQQGGREESYARRGPTTAEQAPAQPEETSAGLAVENGIAHAPEEEALPDDASAATRFWVGRAVSTTSRRGVAGATVVIESLDETGAWAQPATVEGGFFTLRAPPGSPRELRVVIESPADEIGVEAIEVGEDIVRDVGTVWLSGHGVLEGRVRDEQGGPAPGVRLTLRRFGELEASPGAVASATSDEHGAFRLKRLPRGSFALAGVGPEGRRYLAAPVLVPPADALVVAPLPAADLRIDVRNTLREPVAGAKLEAIPQDVDATKEPLDPALFFPPFFATTDADGMARLPFLVPRVYVLLLVLPDGSLFEFALPHAREETRRLIVPVDPRLRLLLIEAPEKGPAHPPFKPLRETTVELAVTGRTSMPDRVVERVLMVKTDDEGVAVLPRLGTTSLHVRAYAREVRRYGAVTLPLLRWGHREGVVSGNVPMRPAPAPRAANVTGVPRRARVTLPGGVPVAGARVYVHAEVKTDEAGEADLGPASDEAMARLVRPDLASGDPHSGEFGRRTLVELTWNVGEVVTVRVSDDVDGFPLSERVRIRPRPSAWRIVAPGIFRSRWDVAYADPETEIVVRVPGYDEWRAPGGPGEFDARLRRPVLPTATLEVEVRSGSAPLPGVRVSGHGGWQTGDRRGFAALTGVQGRVHVAGLAEGPWVIRADAADGRAARREFTLARGRNPLLLYLGGRPLVVGTVLDDRKQPVAGARIERIVEKAFDPQLPIVRTDRNGRFGLGLPHNGRLYLFEARSPGYATQRFEVAARPYRKPLVVTLPRLVAVALPLAWADGRNRPIPDDLVFSISRRNPKKKWRWLDTGVTAHVVDGRLRARGLPPGRLRFAMIGGSAWTPDFQVQASPGQVLQASPVRLRSGGTIEGEVTDDGRPAAGFLFYVGSRPVRTDAQGRFQVTGLPPGTYAIRADDQTDESRIKNRKVQVSDDFISKVTVRISRGRDR